MSAEHDELRPLIEALLACVAEAQVDSARLGEVRWSLTRKLLAHLAKEDALLYPKLRAGRDAEIAAVATQFALEMGSVAGRYRAYVADWPATRIAGDWRGFGHATRQIMDLLLRRIDGEEASLYVLLDADPPRVTKAA